MSTKAAVWILADQLTLDHPALVAAVTKFGREHVRVLLVESQAWLERLPFHKKRQVLYLSAGRHFAAELEAAGYDVDLIAARDSRSGLAPHLKRHRVKQLFTMAAAEYAPRHWQLGSMPSDLGIVATVVPNTMFLVGRHDPLPAPVEGRRYVMETFYRAMRKHFDLLIDPNGSPTGGAWNLDAENRRPLPKKKRQSFPIPPRFEPDDITRKVMHEVEASGNGVGSVKGFAMAVTRADAEIAFADFLDKRLPLFGPFEDAMASDEVMLYHSALSPQMNLGLLDPLAMARAAEAEYRADRAPLNSVEGFIRQIIGWREFIYWQYHRQMPGLRKANGWNATRALPRMLWDGQTEMRCLRSVVARLIDSAYTHHIERLMIICNFAMLTGIDPAAVADWFLTFYADSHDWVVLPNVIGMGLNADGGMTATKPYIASAAYINRMSDFCGGCAYRHDQRTGDDACPFNYLYWNFVLQHEETLRANPRLGPAVLGLNRLSESDRAQIKADARRFLARIEPYAPGPAVDRDDLP
jgi:deoxyribodipyrimidine photolyase-related protein